MARCDNAVARKVAEMIIAELTPVYVMVALAGLAIVTVVACRDATAATVSAGRVRSMLLIGALCLIL
jgi:hypothetical protein